MDVITRIRTFMAFLAMLFGSLELDAQHILFQRTYGPQAFKAGEKNQQASFYDIESLSDDGFATLGFLNDTLNSSEGFLTRYDCTGKPLWTKTLGFSGSPTNTNAGIVEASNGDLVFSFNLGTGFFRASILVGRIDKGGNVKWMKRIGNSTEYGRDIAATADGGFVIAGNTATHGTDNLAADIYLLKLDADGNIVWTKTFGTPSGTYDEAFAVKIDSRQRILATGRCIDDSTFKAFILQADENGNPIHFKTYGYHNQRTNAFDLIVDRDGNYLITGFTTLLEANHASSENDAFLIKVDSALNPIFANIYEVNRGDDYSTIGEGLCQLDDGGYAIGVSTLAFTTHNVNFPNAPNKNALYVLNNNGSIRKAFLYNQHGSQYTRVRKSSMGSVLLGGFSRAYTDRNISQGLVIKTDNRFFSGCFDIDVSSELTTYKTVWQCTDYSFQTRSGSRILNYTNYKDSMLLDFVLCEEIPLLTPDFSGPDVHCPGMVHFTNESSGPGSNFWIVNSDTIRTNGDLDYFFSKEGSYNVVLVLQFSCIVKTLHKTITILPSYQDTIRKTICAGTSYNFKGKEYAAKGIYPVFLKAGPGECDSMFILDLDIQTVQTREESHSYCGTGINLYEKTYTIPGDYQITFLNQQGCDSLILKIKLTKIYEDKAQITELDTQHFCGVFQYKKTKFTKAGSYLQVPVDTTNDCKIEVINLILLEDCECLEFPNAFSPQNGDQINDDFRPYVRCESLIQDYVLQVFNRWGQKVFESSELKKPWDGRFEGKDLPVDTYTYHCSFKIRYSNNDIQPRKIKGSVSLLR